MSEVDFDDEETVRDEVCVALGGDPEDYDIEEDSGYTSFGAGTVYRIKYGDTEYCVVADQDGARELAVEIVKQDLDEDPSVFSKDFIGQHINMDQLKRDLRPDVESERFDYFDELAESDPQRFWDEAAEFGVDKPEEPDDPDDDYEDPDPTDEDVEKASEGSAKELMKDPMSYLEEIYGADEAVEKAIDIGGIDVNAAAEDAVDTDGEGHFLSRYDGETHETKSGLVYWRDQ